MQKIRIGNDIRINISLVDKTEYSASNIKNIKCYLVNKTLTITEEILTASVKWINIDLWTKQNISWSLNQTQTIML